MGAGHWNVGICNFYEIPSVLASGGLAWENMNESYKKLIGDLIKRGYLKSEAVVRAFFEAKREKFVPDEMKAYSSENIPLPIGKGQTISQPLTVAFMLELLDPKAGQNILDIGSGSGWTTALLANIVGKDGKVTALEIIPELSEWGRRNCEKFYFCRERAEFHNLDGSKGFRNNAPYDRILISASAENIPEDVKKQLKIGGKMVIPVKDEIWLAEKEDKNNFKIQKYPGFSFVPFIPHHKRPRK